VVLSCAWSVDVRVSIFGEDLVTFSALHEDREWCIMKKTPGVSTWEAAHGLIVKSERIGVPFDETNFGSLERLGRGRVDIDRVNTTLLPQARRRRSSGGSDS
jgi:hypothetical protein